MKGLPSKTWNGMLILKALKKEEETTESGLLLIPEMANAEVSAGEILVVSEDTKEHFSVGETVLYPSGAGNGQRIGGVECIWIAAARIWATV